MRQRGSIRPRWHLAAAELVTHWTLDDARVRLVIEGEEGAVSRIRADFEPLP